MIESNQNTDGEETKATKKATMQPEHYAFWRYVLDFLHEHKKETFTFRDLLSRYTKEYPEFSHKSRQSYQRQLRKLRDVVDIRHSDQLYVSFLRGGPPIPKGKKLQEAVLDHRVNVRRDKLFKKYREYCYCSSCGNKEIDLLQLHHINGHRKDNRLKNLSVLCANCHMLVHRGRPGGVPLSKQLPLQAPVSMDGQTLPKKTDQCNLIHSSHRWRFSIKYQGKQPTEGGKVSPFGRYRTAIQATFQYENLTITSFKNRLNVWVHQPTGALTEHQRITARERAYMALLQFAREHEITLEGNVKDLLLSHHVVEHPALNDALKPVYQGREEEIKDAIGSGVCSSSHKGKIEHTGIPGGITGYQVGKNLEYLCTKFPGQFSQLTQANMEFRENLVSHLAIMQDIGRTLKELRDNLKKK